MKWELSTYHERSEYLEEDMREDTFRLFEASHASWIGPGSFVEVERDGSLQPLLDELLTRIGYRLRVSEMEVDTAADEAVIFRLTWENTGNAPFYFDWQPTARITSEDGRVWIQALEELSGAYTVAAGILNQKPARPGYPWPWMWLSRKDGMNSAAFPSRQPVV